MSHQRLAIFAPDIGAPSETFIRLHVEALCPTRTVVVTGNVLGQPNATWGLGDIPYLCTAGTGLTGRLCRHAVGLLGEATAAAWDARQIAAFLQRQRVDVAFMEYLTTAARYADAVLALGIPVHAIALGHDISAALRSPLWRRRYATLERLSSIIVINHRMAGRLDTLGLQLPRVEYIPLGIRIPDAVAARAPGAATRFLAVGRMVGKKAPLKLLEAFGRCLRRCTEVELQIVGDGPLYAHARSYAAAQGLAGSVTFHGYREHAFVQRLMRDADVFVQHSIVDPDTGDEEGMPVAILEAMAYGLPIIATAHAGIPEVVEDGATGLLCAEGDVAAMADNMARCAEDRMFTWKMGARARAHVIAHHDWATQRARILATLGLECGDRSSPAHRGPANANGGVGGGEGWRLPG